MPKLNESGDNNSKSYSTTFEVKKSKDGLRGLLNGQYQVLVRILDNSQIALRKGETTVIEAEISNTIYDVEGNLEWLFVKGVAKCFDYEATQQINTDDMPSATQSDDHITETVHRNPPSQSPNQEPPMKNCSRCQKVLPADQIEKCLCIYCRNRNVSSTWDEYDTAY